MSETQSQYLACVAPGCEALNRIAQEVPHRAIPDALPIIRAMLATAEAQQGDSKRPAMVGLAAPQVGIEHRIIVVGTDAVPGGSPPRQFEAFINPRIIWASTIMERGREGCYSTDNICGIVSRHQKIQIKFYNLKGRYIKRYFDGLPARIVQHEIDHLNGIRFPDRIANSQDLHWVPRDRFDDYREHWQTWSDLCPPERWAAIKSGKETEIAGQEAAGVALRAL